MFKKKNKNSDVESEIIIRETHTKNNTRIIIEDDHIMIQEKKKKYFGYRWENCLLSFDNRNTVFELIQEREQKTATPE